MNMIKLYLFITLNSIASEHFSLDDLINNNNLYIYLHFLFQTLTFTKYHGEIPEPRNLKPEAWNFRMESPHMKSRNSPSWISFFDEVIFTPIIELTET